jgi:hypothetical protein
MPPDTPGFSRDRNGNPRVINPDTGKETVYKRPSHYCDGIEDKSGLEKWKMARVVEGAVTAPHLLPTRDDLVDNPRLCHALADDLFKAGGGTSAADAGTEAHHWLEQLDKELITVDDMPEHLRPLAVNWRDLCARHGLRVRPDLVERTMVCDELKAAGTVDNIVERVSDGALFVVDKKTGRQISQRPLNYMAQAAIYAQSVLYDPQTGERTPLDINQDVAYLAHLPISGDSCALIPIDLRTAREIVDIGRRIHDLRSTCPPVRPLVAATPDAGVRDVASPERRAWITDRIRDVVQFSTDAAQDLARTWPGHIPTFKGEYIHTNDDLDTLAALLTKVESRFDMPFGPGDPDRRRVEERDIAIVKAAFPDARLVRDDGELVDDDALSQLKNELDALGPRSQELIQRVASEAKTAKRSISLTELPSRRRFAAAKALVAVAVFEDADVVRALVAQVEPDASTEVTLGHLFGGLSLEQATALQKIAHALDASVLTLGFRADGTPEVHGDVHAVLAA